MTRRKGVVFKLRYVDHGVLVQYVFLSPSFASMGDWDMNTSMQNDTPDKVATIHINAKVHTHL